jgi:serine/threonine protein kinase
MTPHAGQVLHNRYRIDALLGQGGMGAVYRAWDKSLGIPVVVKENLLQSEEAQRQFSREAHILASLRHANLPRVIDHFAAGDQGQYLVMDYVDGEDLKQMVARQGPIPQPQALAWIGDVLKALAYLHGQEPQPIIHRDVKPANVKITPQGQVFLVDFGLAKAYDPRQSTTIGARGVTPGFAPPEQYGQGRTDARTDIYSAGATLYALLTGQKPPDALETVTGEAALVPPRQLNPRIAPEVEVAVLRAMQTRPADRYQSADAFRAALMEMPTRLVSPAMEEEASEPALAQPGSRPLRPVGARPDTGESPRQASRAEQRAPSRTGRTSDRRLLGALALAMATVAGVLLLIMVVLGA